MVSCRYSLVCQPIESRDLPKKKNVARSNGSDGIYLCQGCEKLHLKGEKSHIELPTIGKPEENLRKTIGKWWFSGI